MGGYSIVLFTLLMLSVLNSILIHLFIHLMFPFTSKHQPATNQTNAEYCCNFIAIELSQAMDSF